MTQESKRHINSITKAIEILDCFEKLPTLSLKQINEMTQLHKSRIIRICGTLQSGGFIVYNSETKQYSLGSRLMSLGKIYEQNNDLISVSRPGLIELAHTTGESAAIYVIDNFQRLCLARERGSLSLAYRVYAGQRLDLHSGATSKVLLAFASEKFLKNYLDKYFIKKHTEKTSLDKQLLLKDLKLVRERGYAISFHERFEEIGALAAPIFDYEKKMCASVGIAGAAIRFKKNYKKNYLKHVLGTARSISSTLGFNQ